MYCNAIDRPIVTIICCMTPTRLCRSGAQTSWFCTHPASAPIATAKMAESTTGICSICVPT